MLSRQIMPSTSPLHNSRGVRPPTLNVKCSAGIFLSLGLIMFSLQIACTHFTRFTHHGTMHGLATGVWCGSLLMLTGLFCFCSDAAEKTHRYVRKQKVCVCVCVCSFNIKQQCRVDKMIHDNDTLCNVY